MAKERPVAAEKKALNEGRTMSKVIKPKPKKNDKQNGN